MAELALAVSMVPLLELLVQLAPPRAADAASNSPPPLPRVLSGASARPRLPYSHRSCPLCCACSAVAGQRSAPAPAVAVVTAAVATAAAAVAMSEPPAPAADGGGSGGCRMAADTRTFGAVPPIIISISAAAGAGAADGLTSAIAREAIGGGSGSGSGSRQSGSRRTKVEPARAVADPYCHPSLL